MITEKQQKRRRRHKRVRAKIHGTSKVPRLCVFRSNRHIWTQLIDDEKGQTLAAASDLELKGKSMPRTETKFLVRGKKGKPSFAKATVDKGKRSGKAAIAYEVGKLIAKKALDKKIEKVVFDRGGYKYHGRVKALAEGARSAGLKF